MSQTPDASKLAVYISREKRDTPEGYNAFVVTIARYVEHADEFWFLDLEGNRETMPPAEFTKHFRLYASDEAVTGATEFIMPEVVGVFFEDWFSDVVQVR